MFSYSEDYLDKDKRSPLGIIHVAVFFFFWIALEIRHQFKIRSKIDSSERYKLMTTNEFNQMISEGKKLVLLDDLILDVGKYIFDHPGGP